MDRPSERTDTMRMKAILLVTAAVAFASAPFWSGGFGGFDPDRYPIPQIDPPVQPAGYAFSIWGPIYLWLILSAAFGLLRRAENPAWDAHRWPLVASLAIGTPWISVAVISPIWATVMIWAMLGAALWALFTRPLRLLGLCAAVLGDAGSPGKTLKSVGHLAVGLVFARRYRQRQEPLHAHFAFKACLAALCAARLNGSGRHTSIAAMPTRAVSAPLTIPSPKRRDSFDSTLPPATDPSRSSPTATAPVATRCVITARVSRHDPSTPARPP